MKKLQVPLEDELMEAAKMFAIKNKTTLKEVVANAIKSYVNKKPTQETRPTPTPTPKSSEPTSTPPKSSEPNLYPTLEDIMNEDPDDQYYILRKTAKVGKPLSGGYKYQYGRLIWVVLDGCKMHYDEKGEIIPFRFTGTDGVVYEPDADEIQELEEAFGKPVKIEK